MLGIQKWMQKANQSINQASKQASMPALPSWSLCSSWGDLTIHKINKYIIGRLVVTYTKEGKESRKGGCIVEEDEKILEFEMGWADEAASLKSCDIFSRKEAYFLLCPWKILTSREWLGCWTLVTITRAVHLGSDPLLLGYLGAEETGGWLTNWKRQLQCGRESGEEKSWERRRDFLWSWEVCQAHLLF